MFEWDETKRLSTLEKHKLDFYDVIEMFSGTTLVVPAISETEERLKAIGLLHGRHIAVVFTRRGENIRLITARIARKNERERYDAYLAGGREKDQRAD